MVRNKSVSHIGVDEDRKLWIMLVRVPGYFEAYKCCTLLEEYQKSFPPPFLSSQPGFVLTLRLFL